MQTLVDMVYVDGNLLLTFCNMTILFIAFDCIVTFGGLIGQIKESVS